MSVTVTPLKATDNTFFSMTFVVWSSNKNPKKFPHRNRVHILSAMCIMRNWVAPNEQHTLLYPMLSNWCQSSLTKQRAARSNLLGVLRQKRGQLNTESSL